MYSFSHRDATLEDVDTIYEFGVNNPMHADVACAPIPNPLKTDILVGVEGPDHFIMIFDDEDGSMCAAVQFTPTGRIQNVVLRRFTPPGMEVGEDPKGNAFGAYMFDTIKAYAGRAQSTSPNPLTKDITEALGGEVVGPAPEQS